MRKLEEHFCNFTQKEKLLELGFDGDSHIISAEYYHIISTPFEGILRSQALDFFRDKGYVFGIGILGSGYSYEINIGKNSFAVQFVSANYQNTESNLIDKLIELEMEVQNGK